MNAPANVKPGTVVGLFMVTLATLMYEILLTRIFSVTMLYHFAFVAISVAMFGMTTGAILVYLLPRHFTPERALHSLAFSALLFAVSIVSSFLTHLSIPFVFDKSLVALYAIALTYVVIAVPFVFSGICVCVALTRFPLQISRLYAADLAGAAAGCLLTITDGPTAVIVIALPACVGAALFAAGAGSRRLLWTAQLTGVLFLAFAVGNTILAQRGMPLLRLFWVKGVQEPKPLYEKWNSFSRITVSGDPNTPTTPVGWGLSARYPADRKIPQLNLLIDAAAGTVLTHFQGDLNGRRTRSALRAGLSKSVLGVEINPNILEAVNRTFCDFTGHLDANPNVTLVNDEARSFVARQNRAFDILQVSLIDTWAATAAGAFVLSENSLYTVEAWKLFLQRLSPQGILTFSRWYYRDSPAEVYRLTSLATTALQELGISDPRRHIVIVAKMNQAQNQSRPDGVGTILVSRAPFSDQDLTTLQNVVDRMQFDLILSPRYARDPVFAQLASGQDTRDFIARFPYNITAPTDDSPFFFQMLRLRDIFNRRLWGQGSMSFNVKAVLVLGALLVIVIGLTLVCILLPLALTTQKGALRGTLPLFLFFGSIGLGFLLIEIAQMQRLIVFLGHPTYGLSVVLFALLLSSGAGSALTQRVAHADLPRSGSARLASLLGALLIIGLITPLCIPLFQTAQTPIRILVAVALLVPPGLLMGMAFPLGMKLASLRFSGVTPWFWGINGATSVCASVFAVALALSFGIAATYWIGVACYLAAFLAFLWSVWSETEAFAEGVVQVMRREEEPLETPVAS